MKRFLVTTTGRVEYRCIGSGEVILVCHGGHSSCQDHLCIKGFDLASYQFVIPSRPGYGSTSLKGHESPEATANLFASLMDELLIDRFHLIGISAGGLTALAMASLFPHRISTLVLMSAATSRWLNKTDLLYWMARVMFHPQIEYLTWKLNLMFATAFPSLFARFFFRQVSTERQFSNVDSKELISMIRNQRSGKGFVNDLEQGLTNQAIKGVISPTLIVHSHKDKAVNVKHALEAKAMISHSWVILLHNKWGHMIWFDKNYQEVANQIDHFLNNKCLTQNSNTLN
ncbi:MAG: alpha/beta hydrolase [Cyclobacteriaceae bacterium]